MPLASPETVDVSPENLRLYVLINKSQLSIVQCGVQAAHSIHELIFANKDHPKLNAWGEHGKTLIFLEANEFDIVNKMAQFSSENKICKLFKEPDMDDTITACAFEPMFPHEGKEIFKGFKLI